MEPLAAGGYKILSKELSKVRRKKAWVTSPLMYLMAAAMLAMAIASYPYNRIVFLIEMTAAGLCALGVTVSGILYRTNAVTTLRAAARVLAAEDQEVLEKFALPVAVAAPAGDVVWVNEAFAESLGKGGPCLGEGISRYIYPKTFRQVMEAHNTSAAGQKI